jgi:hypothetical protein
MLPKPTTKGLKTWPDEDRAKINPRGKEVAVETEPVWLLFEPYIHTYNMLSDMFEVWGVRKIGLVDEWAVIGWLLRLIESKSMTDVPQLALMNLDAIDSLILPGIWDWLLRYFQAFEIFGETAIVLLSTVPLSSEQQFQVKHQYTRVKNVIYKPLPAMEELHAILLDALR